MRKLTCPACGEGVVTTSSSADISMIRCPHCGSAMAGMSGVHQVGRVRDSTRCGYCGSRIPDSDSTCGVCGCKNEPTKFNQPIETSTTSANSITKETTLSSSTSVESNATKKLSIVTGILCFFIPFLGVILGLKDRKMNPRKATVEILLSICPTMMFVIGHVIGANGGSQSNSSRDVGTSQQGAPTFKDWILDEFDQYDVTSVDIAGGTVTIYFSISDNLSEDMVVGGAKADVMYMLKDIAESGYDYSEIRIIGRFPMIDSYGNSEIMNVVDLRYSRSTIDRINWSGFLYENAFAIADSRNIHPAFQR